MKRFAFPAAMAALILSLCVVVVAQPSKMPLPHAIAKMLTVEGTTALDGAFELGGTAITSSAAEINILDGVTASAAELNLNDGAVAGTAVASKTLALGANKNVDVLAVADGGLSLGAGAGTAITSTAAEINLIDGSTAGTNVASKALVVGADKAVDTLGLSAGATAAAVAQRFGASATEGLETLVIDEDVTLTNAASTDLTNTIPSGAVILSVQANLDDVVVGDGSGDDGLVKVGIGTSGDPDKYGLSGALTADTKADDIPDWAVLSGAEQIGVYAVDTNGAAVTEKFVGSEVVRVRVVYLALNSLDDAA